jgi:undecaprenyl-diphosphatase
MLTAGKSVYEGIFLETINNYAGHHPAFDELMRVLVAIGVLPLVILIILFACCSKDAWRRKGGWISLAGAALAIAITWRLDSIFARPRPFLNHHIRLLIACPDSLSFPSPEMAAAGAIAFGLFAYGSRLRLFPLLYLLIMGFARVYCGLEYPLDQC